MKIRLQLGLVLALAFPFGSTAMDLPNQMIIRLLARTDDPKQNEIKRVELLGHRGRLKFSQTTNGLLVELPGERLSDLTCAVRITGNKLKPAPMQ